MTFCEKRAEEGQEGCESGLPRILKKSEGGQGGAHGEDEDQRRSSREAFVKITLDFLRRMKQEELADCLQTSKGISPHGILSNQEMAPNIFIYVKVFSL